MRLISRSGLFLTLVLPSPAVAEHWTTAMPPIGSGNTITCDSAFDCARRQQAAYYGTVRKGGCYFSFNQAGQKVTARCDGWHGSFLRPGFASIRCDANEQLTAAGCVKNPPSDKNPECSSQVGNPVDTRSGAKTEHVEDFSTEGPFPLKFNRFYNSETNFLRGEAFEKTRLGRGWRSNFDSKASYEGQPTATAHPVRAHFVLPDGTSLTFGQSSGQYTRQHLVWNTQTWAAGSQGVQPGARLVKNAAAARYELTVAADDTVYSYDYSGFLRSISYRGGYIQTLEYTGGNNSAVQDSFGKRLEFAYAANGLLQTMTAPDGQIFSYAYTDKSDPAYFTGVAPDDISREHWALARVAYVDGNSDPADNPDIVYHYENPDFPFALTGVTDEREVRYATWTYDDAGKVIESRHAGGANLNAIEYNAQTNSVTATNALGKLSVHRFAKDSRGLNKLTNIEGVASNNCPASNSTIAYGSAGFIEQETDAEGRVTKYFRNARGLPTSITEGFGTPEERVRTIAWHATHQLPTQIVEPGLTTELTYDASGRLTELVRRDTTSHTVPYATAGEERIWSFTYTSGGLLQTADGPLPGAGDSITYEYTPSGFLSKITNEAGHETLITAHDGAGRPTAITDPNGVVSELDYSPRGWLTSVTVDPGASESVTAYAYDAAGQVTRVTQPDGAFLDFAYDDARRLISVTNADGETIEYARDAMGGATEVAVKDASGTLVAALDQTFDELGRLLGQIGADAQTTIHGYDRTDNIVSVTDPRSNIYGYAFDALNRLKQETDQDGDTVNLTRNAQDEVTNHEDRRGLETNYVRNGFGDVLEETSPDKGVTINIVNALGLVTQMTDSRGVIVNQTYDDLGRLVSKSYPAIPSENVTQEWDGTAGGNKGIGRLTRIEDETGSAEFVYDSRGNRVSELRTIGGAAYSVSYQFDAADQVTAMVYPSGREVRYTRDDQGRIASAETRAGATATWEDVATGVAHMPFGPLQSMTHGNGLSLWKTFDGDYDPDQLLVEDGAAGTRIMQRFHGYTDGMNLTNIWDEIDPSKDQNYWYAPTQALQNAGGPWSDLTYYYDENGNRTFEIEDDGIASVTRRFWYPSTSNLIDEVEENGVTVRSFSHDAAGNLSSETGAGPSKAFARDQAGRLSAFSLGGTSAGEYTYDALNRLVVRTLPDPNPVTIHNIYDVNGRLIAEADATGATQREYIWLDDLPVAVVDDVSGMPSILTVHADHLGRPVKMTDASRATVWDATYLPFGGVHEITGSATLEARFPGQWLQLESGLTYNWHRHYDPSTGRYLEPDPLGFADGPNLYAYAGSNPVMWIDPTGESKVVAAIAGAAIGAAGNYGWQTIVEGKCATCVDPQEVVASAVAGATVGIGVGQCYRPLFRSGGGLLNSSRYLRVGEGRYGGRKSFRASGEVIERVFGKTHINIKDMGPWKGR